MLELSFAACCLYKCNLLFLHSDNKQVLYGNIMYDRRIIRGNTYALNQLPAVSEKFSIVYLHTCMCRAQNQIQ